MINGRITRQAEAVLQDGQRTVRTRALFHTDNPIYTLRSLPIHCCALPRGLKLSAIDISPLSMAHMHREQLHVVAKFRNRNGNGMDGMEMEEMRGKKEIAKLDYNNANQNA